MQVFHTAGDPPSRGRTILPTIGCTRNSRNALTNSVSEKRAGRKKEKRVIIVRRGRNRPSPYPIGPAGGPQERTSRSRATILDAGNDVTSPKRERGRPRSRFGLVSNPCPKCVPCPHQAADDARSQTSAPARTAVPRPA